MALAERELFGLTGRRRSTPTWSAMRRLPDQQRQICPSGSYSIWRMRAADPEQPVDLPMS